MFSVSILSITNLCAYSSLWDQPGHGRGFISRKMLLLTTFSRTAESSLDNSWWWCRGSEWKERRYWEAVCTSHWWWPSSPWTQLCLVSNHELSSRVNQEWDHLRMDLWSPLWRQQSAVMLWWWHLGTDMRPIIYSVMEKAISMNYFCRSLIWERLRIADDLTKPGSTYTKPGIMLHS